MPGWRRLVAGALVLPLLAGAAMAQVLINGGGGGGGGIAVGVTPITGGTANRILFDLGGLVGESANLTFNTSTNASLLNGPTVIGGTGVTSTNKALVVNNGAATGNILEVQDNGVAQLTIADGGVATFVNRVAMNGGWALLAGQAYYLGLTSYPTGSMFYYSTPATPDAFFIATGTTSRSFHVAETGDEAFDFQNGPCGSAACTDPAQIIHSHNQVTTEYLALQHDGTNAVFSAGKGGLKLVSSGTKPTCDAASRGTFYYTAAGAGVKDAVEVCAKDAGDAYAFRTIY